MWDESAPGAPDGPAAPAPGAAAAPGRTGAGGAARRPGALALLIRPRASLQELGLRPRSPRALLAYVLGLSAVPPLARAIGLELFGGRDAAGAFQVAPLAAALDAGVAWGAILIASAGFAAALWLITKALRANVRPRAAAALMAYASTPGWLGGLFKAAPGLDLLYAACVLLGLRVLWIGGGILLGLPPRPRLFLVALAALSAVLLQTLLGTLIRLVFALA